MERKQEKKTYFISADIEGITDVTAWNETEPGGFGYEEARKQMTLEVAAACQAILDAGHRVVVRDGHNNAMNLIHSMLPKGVMLMRGWASDPASMMSGVGSEYAGVLYIGYHAPAGTDGSPLAHTVNPDSINWIKVNGRLASEFTLNTLYAAEKGVAPIFLSGDRCICELAEEEVPAITTVAVKDCRGNSTFNLHPEDACDQIKVAVAKALEKQVSVPVLPEELVMDINLKHHQAVRAALANPDVKQLDESTVRYVAHSAVELAVVREFIMG
ncbi:MAG: M55 family metallopeptidase [Firmicutes bacterium]|nr:M55 family metallopeptidase [Bacillota bacterium]